jgi:hypothetical protein
MRDLTPLRRVSLLCAFDLFDEVFLLGSLAAPLDGFFGEDALPASELVVVRPT